MLLNINDSLILWPGKLERKPEGIIIPTHLKVLTIEEKPFIYVRRLDEDEGECDPQMEIPCPMFNATDGTGKRAWAGNPGWMDGGAVGWVFPFRSHIRLDFNCISLWDNISDDFFSCL